ncbi:MAG: hypothetical protein KIH62_000750 [Candidatus Kerfeldbacteria bacterium]|nr:hypothetical protein [Candidatus Kerfeldbacteria bacterium]
MLDFLEYITKERPNKVLLIHHWDTDGLASAALIQKYAHAHQWPTHFTLMHPQINNYFLTEKELKSIEAGEYGAIITVDLNFPLSTIEALEGCGVPVFVFDHHTQTANINRPGVQNTSYPGCSMLINDYLLEPLSLTAVLGMVGDQEMRITTYTDFYPQVEQMMKEHRVTLKELIHITKLIDSCYVWHDEVGMKEAIQMLHGDPLRIKTTQHFIDSDKKLSQELLRVLSAPLVLARKKVHTLHIESKASIISEATRFLSAEHPDDVIITDQSYNDFGNIYVRRNTLDIDLSYIAVEARKRGYTAGGKTEVTGIILPHTDVEQFKQWIIDSLPV